MVFITTDGFLGDEGTRNEERLVDNAVRVVREGANDLAIQLRVKNAGKTQKKRSLARGEEEGVLDSRAFFLFCSLINYRFLFWLFPVHFCGARLPVTAVD